jgi:transposase
MESITTVGIDLAKSVFQIHAIDAAGKVVVSRAIRRRDFMAFMNRLPPCLIGMEACASSHHWARQLKAMGHEVRLIPPAYVKAYVRRQKNDAADAAAICEAVTRPSMRFVPVKTEARQAALMMHRTRALLVSQRTALICALRGHLAEFGLVSPSGPRHLTPLLELFASEEDDSLPCQARRALWPLVDQLRSLECQIEGLDRQVLEQHRSDETSQRLATIPGIGPLTASALAASVTDPAMFASGREFAAFLGLAPRQASSGGKERLGPISKMGDRYLRTLLVVGAASVLRHPRTSPSAMKTWAVGLLEKKPFKLAAVALANKMARVAWAIMTRGETFRDGVPAVAD